MSTASVTTHRVTRQYKRSRTKKNFFSVLFVFHFVLFRLIRLPLGQQFDDCSQFVTRTIPYIDQHRQGAFERRVVGARSFKSLGARCVYGTSSIFRLSSYSIICIRFFICLFLLLFLFRLLFLLLLKQKINRRI